MLKYYTESEDNMNMDVQVGPGEEITAKVDGVQDEGCCKSEGCGKNEGCCKSEGCNPVDQAKKNAESVTVVAKKTEGCCEFYVSAADVAKHADLNEQTMLESLNDIILCNEDAGMTASNVVVVVDESTFGYVRNLERHGAACVRFVNEADAGVEDIQMQVQVGPQGDEMQVKADPQDANPVDAVKRQYDTVVVAKDGDDFFMDVEDVQKCAELNCESVIDTINGVISCNEEFEMNTENVRVICNENTDISALTEMVMAGVLLEAEFTFLPKLERNPDTKKYVDDLKEAQALCKEKNIDSKAGAMKALRIACRVLDIYYKISSVCALPILLSIIGVIPYLAIRALQWLCANGEESAAKAEGKKVIAALDEAIAKEEDEKAKEKLQATKDKLEESMKKVNSAFDNM